MKNRRKKKNKGFGKMGIIYISIIALLNMVGVGYGFWTNGLEIQAIVTTGEIKAVLGNASVISENAPNVAWASSNGNRMHIGMQNAFPGYSAVINYEVRNEGTIPITCDTPEVYIDQKGNLLPVSIELNPPSGTIKGYGESKTGTILITVGDFDQSKAIQKIYKIKQKSTKHVDPLNLPIVENCGFSMRLVYHQATSSN